MTGITLHASDQRFVSVGLEPATEVTSKHNQNRASSPSFLRIVILVPSIEITPLRLKPFKTLVMDSRELPSMEAMSSCLSDMCTVSYTHLTMPGVEE